MPRISSSAFIGRAPELARLRAALDLARGGQSRFVLIGGEAGIGKTRLVSELVNEARVGGSLVIVGGSPVMADADLPFAAVIEALRSLVRQLPPARLDEVLGSARPELARLLPALAPTGQPRPDGEAQPELDTAQTHLFEGILGVLERLSDGTQPAILVLEDLHWADRSSRELLAFLVRNLRDAAVLIVGTYRADGVVPGHPLRILLAELDRAEPVERLDLAGLGRDDVGAQLGGILGEDAAPELVDDVFGRSDGNPFFAEELVAALAAGTASSLPDTLRETLLGRIATQPAEVQELLRTASVAGRRFDPRLVAVVTRFEEPVLMGSLREAVRHNLLVVVRDPEGERFEFRHGLLREAVYDDVLPGERSRRHALVALVLAANPELQTGTPAEREVTLANHWLAADEPVHALPALIRAGLAAEEARAFPEASVAFEAALRIWDRAVGAPGQESVRKGPGPIGFRARGPEAGEDPAAASLDRADVMRHAAETAALIGSAGRAVELTAALIATMGDDADALDLGLATERLGRYRWEDGDSEGALEAYRRAATVVQDTVPSAAKARVLGALARALVSSGQYAEAQGVCEQAIAVGEAAGAESEVRRVRDTYGVALAFQGEVEGGLEQLVAARQRAVDRSAMSIVRPRPSRIGDVVRGFADLASVLERAGRSDDAANVSMEGSELARELGVEATWGSLLEVHAAAGKFHMGEWDEADRMTRRLLSGSLRGAPAARLHLVRARLELGRGAFDDADLHLEAARVRLPTGAEPMLVAELASTVAELAIWRSQLTEARAAVDDGLRRLHEGEDPLPITGLCWLGVRAEADRAEQARLRKRLAEVAGATETAASLRAELVGIVHQGESRAHLAPRDLRVYPALLGAEWSRLEDGSDADLWASAAERTREIHDVWLTAYALWREAEAVLAARGSRPRAEASMREAYAIATSLEADPLRRELEALARRARVDLTTGPADSTPLAAGDGASSTDRLGLTAREMEVLSLVAEGKTNRQIADELFITEKTAGHHVSNLLGKLDASTRAEAAAMAHRLGWLDERTTGSSPGPTPD